jgi:hypothetical protein
MITSKRETFLSIRVNADEKAKVDAAIKRDAATSLAKWFRTAVLSKLPSGVSPTQDKHQKLIFPLKRPRSKRDTPSRSREIVTRLPTNAQRSAAKKASSIRHAKLAIRSKRGSSLRSRPTSHRSPRGKRG